MTGVDLREAFDPDKPVSLPNRKCADCGELLERRTTTQDHLVGQRFVPEGTLATGVSPGDALLHPESFPSERQRHVGDVAEDPVTDDIVIGCVELEEE